MDKKDQIVVEEEEVFYSQPSCELSSNLSDTNCDFKIFRIGKNVNRDR